jgi:hypothetical protein
MWLNQITLKFPTLVADVGPGWAHSRRWSGTATTNKIFWRWSKTGAREHDSYGVGPGGKWRRQRWLRAQMAALPWVVAEMAGQGFGQGNGCVCVLCATGGRVRGGQANDTGGHVHCLAQRIHDPNLIDWWIDPRESVRLDHVVEPFQTHQNHLGSAAEDTPIHRWCPNAEAEGGGDEMHVVPSWRVKIIDNMISHPVWTCIHPW